MKSDGEIYQRLFELLKGHATDGRPLYSVGSVGDVRESLSLERMAGTTYCRETAHGVVWQLVHSLKSGANHIYIYIYVYDYRVHLEHDQSTRNLKRPL